MKLSALVIGLLFSSSVMADAISFERDGSGATLSGTMNSTSYEILKTVAAAYDEGFKDARGANFFHKIQLQEGSRSYLAFKNKSLTATEDAGFALVYKVALKGRAGDITVNNDRSAVTLKGNAARILLGAIATARGIYNRGSLPYGVGRVATDSGKVICVLPPRTVPSCTLKI